MVHRGAPKLDIQCFGPPVRSRTLSQLLIFHNDTLSIFIGDFVSFAAAREDLPLKGQIAGFTWMLPKVWLQATAAMLVLMLSVLQTGNPVLHASVAVPLGDAFQEHLVV